MVQQLPVASCRHSERPHWQLTADNWRPSFCYAFRQMWVAYRWTASRWTARCLLLVMLVPAFGPLAMAQAGAMHCLRPMASTETASPEMPCHHAMAHPHPTVSKASDVSLQAGDSNCCANHCCCGAFTSEWAEPASSLLSFLALLIEPAHPAQAVVLRSSNIFGLDSARAPPRS